MNDLIGTKIEGVYVQGINCKNTLSEIIFIAGNNYALLTNESKNKSISKFNAMRSERNYWKGVKELAEILQSKEMVGEQK